MIPVSFADLDDLLKAAPQDLGATDWISVDARAIADFARSTGAPAPATGAPPLLILSLTNRLLPLLLQVPGASSAVNYGAASVRFESDVEAGDRIRARATLLESSEVPGGVQTLVEISVEIEGAAGEEGPVQTACVVESLSRWFR